MSQTNFLIERGELLTHEIKGPKRIPGKAEVVPGGAGKRDLLGAAGDTPHEVSAMMWGPARLLRSALTAESAKLSIAPEYA